MRILIDACLPQTLRHEFVGHDAFTAAFKGWEGLLNGQLLAVMVQDSFDALITVDSNLPHQQSVAQTSIRVFVLRAPTNRRIDLLPLIPKVLQMLPLAAPGTVTEITA